MSNMKRIFEERQEQVRIAVAELESNRDTVLELHDEFHNYDDENQKKEFHLKIQQLYQRQIDKIVSQAIKDYDAYLGITGYPIK